MDIERLIEDLFNATYREPNTLNEYSIACTNAQREALVKVIRTWANSQPILGEVNELRIKNAELEAKLFAYEAIITKSNFKPMTCTNIRDDYKFFRKGLEQEMER